jgi:hypothetical protein
MEKVEILYRRYAIANILKIVLCGPLFLIVSSWENIEVTRWILMTSLAPPITNLNFPNLNIQDDVCVHFVNTGFLENEVLNSANFELYLQNIHLTVQLKLLNSFLKKGLIPHT